MATIAQRLVKLGATIAPWLPWIISNRPQWIKYQHAFGGHAEFQAALLAEAEVQGWTVAELNEALAQDIVFSD